MSYLPALAEVTPIVADDPARNFDPREFWPDLLPRLRSPACFCEHDSIAEGLRQAIGADGAKLMRYMFVHPHMGRSAAVISRPVCHITGKLCS